MKTTINHIYGLLLIVALAVSLNGCGLLVEVLGFGEVGALAVETRALTAARSVSLARTAATAETMAGRAAVARTASGGVRIVNNSALFGHWRRVRVSTSPSRNPRMYIVENGAKIEFGEIEAMNSVKIWDTNQRITFTDGRLVQTKQRLTVWNGPDKYKALYDLDEGQLILQIENSYPGWSYIAITNASGETEYGYVQDALIAPLIIPKPVVSKKCDNCNGLGHFSNTKTCDECNGNGNLTCDQCDGNGVNSCDICSGKKRLPCGVCDGKKRHVCHDCEGMRGLKCRSCNGMKYFVCQQCSGRGIYKCEICKGSRALNNGSVTKPCYSCNGRGSKVCGYCKQSGNIPCNSCSQTGITKCYTCNQTGNVPCHSCNHIGSTPCTTCQSTGVMRCNYCFGKGFQHCKKCSGSKTIAFQTNCTKCNGGGSLYYYAGENH